MKDEPQLFTRTDVQGSPVEADVLDTLEGIGMTEELLRTYIQEAEAGKDDPTEGGGKNEALIRLYIRNKLLISEHA